MDPKSKDFSSASYCTHNFSLKCWECGSCLDCNIQRHSTLDDGKIALSFRNGGCRSDPKMKAEAREANNLANLTWKDFWGYEMASTVK